MTHYIQLTDCFSCNGVFFAQKRNLKAFLSGIALLLAINLQAQIGSTSCAPFTFEVREKSADPTIPHSSPSQPGAFQMYYIVSVKGLNGGVLPSAFSFNFLSFSGKVSVNGFTSKVNINDSNTLTAALYGGNNPYATSASLTLSESGEVSWVKGTAQSLCGSSGSDTETLNFPATNSVRLFVIVIDAAPGDQIGWLPVITGSVQVCQPFCSSQVPVTIVSNSTNGTLTFPAPPSCPNLQMSVDQEVINGARYIRIQLGGLTVNQGVTKIDGVIHIEPQMTGIASLDFTALPYNVSNTITTVKRKNADGSFDIYYTVDFFQAYAATQPIVAIKIEGLYNLSLGGVVICQLPFARVITNNNLTVCSPALTSPANILLPGYAACANDLKITATRYTGPNCVLGVKYTFTHNSPIPLTIPSLLLNFGYRYPSQSNLQPTVVNPLACPNGGCGTFTANDFGTNSYRYKYENTSPLTIANGTEIIVPFDISNECVRYFILQAEVTDANGNKCALQADINISEFPACNPNVHGRVHLSDGDKVRNYKVVLESTNVNYPGYVDEILNDCETSYSFCSSKSPFRLKVVTSSPNDCMCGVSTYDLVLISRHILGLQAITSPYLLIAANSDLGVPQATTQSITTFDIVAIRQGILGITTCFGSNNSAPSWYYIRDNFTFSNNDNPFNNYYTNPSYTTANVSDVPSNGMGNYGDFTAVKVGDINLSCKCGGFRPADREANNPVTLAFKVDTKNIQYENKTILVPVYADAPFDLIALQAAFRFDPSTLRLEEVIPNDKIGVTAEDFGYTDVAQGLLRFAWYSFDGGTTTLPKGALLFTAKFTIMDERELATDRFLWLSESTTPGLAYSADGTEYKADLNWSGKGISKNLQLIVSPSPFQETTQAYIFTETAGNASVRLLNTNGKVVMEQSLELQTGDNILEINADDATPGIYSLTLEINGQRITKYVSKL